MKKGNKTGRPVKAAGRKKGYCISLKMDTQQYYTLKAKAREAGISISECIRQSVMEGAVRQRISPETLDLVRKLCGMANNLNQVARKANAQGYESVSQENLRLTVQIRLLVNHIRYDG